MNIIAKISAKLAGRDLYSGSESGHLESPQSGLCSLLLAKQNTEQKISIGIWHCDSSNEALIPGIERSH